ncbi:MAG: carbonic anhydrase [Sulfuricurvum sp. PC08-66]|nr:MAG: carbonic anhydrase [Sulfuricurvum sp. PC08-66]
MMTNELLEGNETFVKTYFKKHEKELLDLAKNGQHPKALFIGCADSRILPNLITQSDPGDLFVLRNVGNFVAPYRPDEDFHAMAAGIEYAVAALNVQEIIICGHTQCGAISALYSNFEEQPFIHTRKWLSLGKKAKQAAQLALGREAKLDDLLRLTEKFSIISQIEHLLTYPLVKERVDNGTLYVHGWLYYVENGLIEYYDPDDSSFKSLHDLEA